METPLPPASAPAPVIAANEDKTIALLAHLITFVSSFIGPLIIYLVKKDESPFVAAHAKEVLNFHISVLIYAVVLFFSIFGIVLLPPLGIFVLIVTIIGAIRAYEGGMYRYPLCIRFIA